jgi:hypothetical protein
VSIEYAFSSHVDVDIRYLTSANVFIQAIFLVEQLLGPDQAPAGKRADQFFAAVLFFVSKEMGTALTLSDCSVCYLLNRPGGALAFI